MTDLAPDATAPAVKRILCPIDFSDASGHVIDQAVAFAGWYNAAILGLHVCTPLVVPTMTMGPIEGTPQIDLDRMQAQLRRAFEPAVRRAVDVDVAVDTGQPAAEILRRAASLPADLIVMGTHGASGFERLLLGSVAEKVLRKARCPVLTVPPHAQATSTLPFKRLLCALDFSDPSLAALWFACSLARESGARLTILHVIEWPWTEPPAPSARELPREQAEALAEFRRYLEASAMRRLETIVPDSLAPGLPPDAMVRHGKAYVEVLRAAVETRADLIVAGVHGRNAIDLAFLGSTTNHLVRHATCPVLTLKR
jgi:nucleotide-binding universal stress UspA family protein